MTSSMKALMGVCAAAALLGAAGAGLAQDGPRSPAAGEAAAPGAGARQHPQMRHDPQKAAERRAQMLRQRLALRSDQEPALQAYLSAARPHGDRAAREALKAMTTPERLDRQLEAMRKRADATKRFYGALTPEQRRTFDSMTARPHKAHHDGGRHGEGRRDRRGGGHGPRGGQPQAGPEQAL